jgi:flagellar FliJ protein
MAKDKARQLDRLLRVRTLQLGMTRAEEVRVQQKMASEAELASRIARLADSVSPVQAEAGSGFSLVAAAHFRSRLHQSAEMAEARLRDVEALAERAAEATREARRDQSAVEKLMARADRDAALKAIRALESAPAVRKIRHDPC